MKKLCMYQDGRSVDVKQFLLTLPDKQRDKFLRQIAMLILPRDTLGRPQVKHFQMDRYRCLYELRDKYQNQLIRIIFAYTSSGDVVLLEAFIKDHKRKTDVALASALEKLRQIENDPTKFLLEVDIRQWIQELLREG